MDKTKKIKLPYVSPVSEIVRLENKPVMVKASPGVGSEWNYEDEIDAKEFCLDYLPTEFTKPWDV